MQCPACREDNIPGTDRCEHCGTPLYKEDIPLAHARTAIERRLHEQTVEVLRPAEPLTVGEQCDLQAAVATMREHRIGCLIVINEAGLVSGILSEQDILRKVPVGQKLPERTVSEVMTSRPEVVEAGQPLAYVLHRMMVGDIRHVPVTDAGRRPVGVVSSRDVINYLETEVRKSFSDA